MNYTPETIRYFIQLMKGDDSARVWLQRNNFHELILLHFALEGKEEAMRELTKLKFVALVAFAHAIVNGDVHAANWLAENKKFEWAAVVRYVNKKDRNAEMWLLKHKLYHFAELARAIREKEEATQDDDILGLFRKFIQSFRKKK
jgi:hypothetical protein